MGCQPEPVGALDAAIVDVAADVPVAADRPDVADAPIIVDRPVVTDTPVVIDRPIVTDTPVATDTPVVVDRPVATDIPVTTDVPPPDAGVDASVDAGGSFCATTLCPAGTHCCEAARTCIRIGALCINVPPDAGPSGCATAADCARGEECVYPDTACAPRGACIGAIACFVALPFCACDGATYRGCRPDRPTSARGECPSGRDAGPGGCTTNAQCGARQWCAGTGCDTPGTCEPLGDACTALYAPVCGCDGRTYSNECVANVSGVRAASRGACAP